ncbi:hypothetical protein E2320_016451 [Naja naja]|nr:hypothetical protein E2320_016451 [Naja naja]
MKVLVLTLLFLLIVASEAKQYSRCELASRLKQRGLDGSYGYSLAMTVRQPNWDGSRNYDIFQINSAWWCNNYQGRTANGCNKACSDFTDDDITDDIVCAKRIVQTLQTRGQQQQINDTGQITVNSAVPRSRSHLLTKSRYAFLLSLLYSVHPQFQDVVIVHL